MTFKDFWPHCVKIRHIFEHSNRLFFLDFSSDNYIEKRHCKEKYLWWDTFLLLAFIWHFFKETYWGYKSRYSVWCIYINWLFNCIFCPCILKSPIINKQTLQWHTVEHLISNDRMIQNSEFDFIGNKMWKSKFETNRA